MWLSPELATYQQHLMRNASFYNLDQLRKMKFFPTPSFLHSYCNTKAGSKEQSAQKRKPVRKKKLIRIKQFSFFLYVQTENIPRHSWYHKVLHYGDHCEPLDTKKKESSTESHIISSIQLGINKKCLFANGLFHE